MEPAREIEFDGAYRKVLVLYSALIMVVPVLFVVASVVSREGGSTQETDPMLLWAFRAVAVAAFFISFPAGRWIRGLGLKVNTESPKGERYGTHRADALIGNMTTYAIVPYAVCEIAVLLGFVLFILYGSWSSFALLGSLTVVGWVAHFPRRGVWFSLVEEQEAIDAGYDPIVS